MAANSVAIPKTKVHEYQLPEAVRQRLWQESTDRPTACISPKRLAVVERQRQRFIAQYGSDGCSTEI
jgi:hypothetical protein